MAESSESKVTTNHDEIRRWVEDRGGHPARVKDTESKNSPGLLRIDYPGFSGGDSLEAISWDEFFMGFDENNLAFLYQEKTKDGKQSRFSKLIDRSSEGHYNRAAEAIYSLSRLVSFFLSAATKRLHSGRAWESLLKSSALSVSKPLNISFALPVVIAFSAALLSALNAAARCEPVTANFARS